MRVKIIGPQIDSGGSGRGPKHCAISSRNFAAYSESTTSEGIVFKGECDVVLSVEQAQQLVISLFGMLPAADRPVLTWPYSRREK